MTDQLRHNEARCVAGHRKADALCTCDHSRIDANHLTLGRYQCATGVAWVQGRIGLDHILDQAPGLSAQAPSKR
jgi:hypothetical protein